MPKPKKKQRIQTREELIYALCRAAEIEHGLTCIYLFTAFTMKKFLYEGIDQIQRDKIRDWQSLIYQDQDRQWWPLCASNPGYCSVRDLKYSTRIQEVF